MSNRVKPIWEGGAVHPDSPNKVFCTAPWTHTYISPQSERRMCCASREEHQFQKQYIDASNDESTGITSLLMDIKKAGIKLADLSTSQTSLEEIFVDMVNK